MCPVVTLGVLVKLGGQFHVPWCEIGDGGEIG